MVVWCGGGVVFVVEYLDLDEAQEIVEILVFCHFLAITALVATSTIFSRTAKPLWDWGTQELAKRERK
jgi:hypothetical protein